MSNNKMNNIKSILGGRRIVAIMALVIIYLFFFLVNEQFRSINTLSSIFDSSYYLGFLAIGVTFVIATGGIDLSLGTVMICSALVGRHISIQFNLPILVTMILVILIAMLFGLFNGILITKFHITPFIATLATQLISRGLGMIVTKVQTQNFPLRTESDGWYRNIFKISSPFNFPTGIILLIVAAGVMMIILNKTKVGRYILAIGSNKEAARLSGINVAKWELLAYVICGFFVGVAGIAFAATYTTIIPGEGAGFELDAIAAAVIGGTSLTGGVASVLGTVIGLFIMTVLKIGLPFIGLQAHYQIFITGFVILIAVLADIYKSKKDINK